MLNAVILISIFAAFGALARHALNFANTDFFPIGTLGANYLGSFLIGALSVSDFFSGKDLKIYLAVGLLGALTTFSGFAFEAIKMLERGQWGLLMTYVLSMNIGCLLLVYAGRKLI